ncbi:stress response protein YvgO [Bacillus changyiensis]|uniref:stress response protein YvgO n=1 Tax=Bacillus changyiensis TaxID=3004103 RepID=UPI0022E1BE8D|nr:stress response protein YvgO [Bacillus changyiensis]MDA1475244.1 stress response protein YvgO [Bacillus changyiensis]
MKKMLAFITALVISLSCLPYLAEAKETKQMDTTIKSLPSTSLPSHVNQPLKFESKKFKTSAIDLGINLDLLGIGNQIRDSIVQSANRSGFVKNCMESAFYAAGQRYNVMVFNLSQNYQERLRGVKFYGSANYHGVIYGIWVFENGEFTNQGDGGWINWAFKGWFDRNGKHVTFRKP